MRGWWVWIVGLAVLWLRPEPARAVPATESIDDRAEWAWQAVPVFHGVPPQTVRGEAPFVPRGSTPHTGPVQVTPDEAVVVWLSAFATVRVRKTRPAEPGTPRFSRVEPMRGLVRARVAVQAEEVEPATWQLHNPVGWGAPWVIQSDRAIEIVVEQAVPRRGAAIWEQVHDEVLAWVEGDGSLPRLPAAAGSERYLRRRLADREWVEALLRAWGDDATVAQALQTWRLLRASSELALLRPLIRIEPIRPTASSPVVLRHRPEDLPLARLAPGRPWRFTARGPAVLRLDARALLADDQAPARSLSLVVRRRDPDGTVRVLGRIDTVASAARVRDPTAPDGPIPTLIEATTRDGERVSLAHRLAVPLEGGRHRYEVEVVGGGDVAVQARIGMVAERIHARDSWAWRARARQRALASLRGHDTPAAVVARMMLDPAGIDPEVLPDDVADALGRRARRVRAAIELDALYHQERSATSRVDRIERIAPWVPRSGRPAALDTELRVELFEAWMASGRPRRAVDAVGGDARWLNGDELVALVDALDGVDPLWPLPGALDAVAARAPLGARLRAAHTGLWRRTQWVRLRPDALDGVEDGGGASPDAVPDTWRWIEPARPDDPPPREAPSPGTLWSMPVGAPVQLQALAHPYEPDRSPVLRVVAHAVGAVEGTLSLRVGMHRWSVPVRHPRETFEVVLPVGVHEVQLDAPTGIRAFSTLHPPPDDPAWGRPAPRHSTMWSSEHAGRPVTFPLGALPRDTLVQVDLRVIDAPAQSEEVAAWIHFDDGRRHRVWLQAVTDPALVAVDAPPGASARARVVVPVTRRASRLWVVPEGSHAVAVAAKVRRWEPPPPDAAGQGRSDGGRSGAAESTEPAAVAPSAGEPRTPGAEAGEGEAAPSSADGASAAAPAPYQRLAASTRRVAAAPHDVAARVEHARTLLDVGEVRRARQALVWAVHGRTLVPDDSVVDEIRRLQARIDAFVSDDYVVLGASALHEPMLLAPALAAVETDDPAHAQVVAGTRARDEGRSREAFETLVAAHPRRDPLPVSYAAALALAEALRALPEGGADPRLSRQLPLAHGLGQTLRDDVDTPRLRWLRSRVAGATRWETLRLVERSAGTIDVDRPRPSLATDPVALTQWALLAPPWDPDEATVVRAGSKQVIGLQLRRATEVALELFCADRDATIGSTPVRVELRQGDRGSPATTQIVEVEPRTPTMLRIPAAAGSRRLELVVGSDAPEQRCAVRWTLTERDAALPEPARPQRWFVAQRGTPVEAIVLAPTSLRVQLQATAPRTTTATITITDVEGTALRSHVVTLRDPAVVQESILLLHGDGPRRVRVQTDAEPLHVALALRRLEEPARGTVDSPGAEAGAGADPAAPLPAAQRVSLGTAFESARVYWPSGGDARPWERVETIPRSRVARFGSLEAGLGLSRTDITESDDPRPRNRVRASLGWRRELWPGHLWIKIFGHGQGRDGAGGAAGADATLYAQRGARALRGRVTVAGWSEAYAGQPAWSVRATAHIDRPLTLSRTLVLVPWGQVSYRHQSLDGPDVDFDLEPSHAQVYSDYIEEHPLAPAVGGRLRWLPFADLQVALEASSTPNADLASIDHADSGVSLQGIVRLRRPMLLRYGLGYDGSLRLADADRSRTFVRHGPGASAGLTWIFQGIGRLHLDLRDTVYLSRPFATRNSAELMVSFELTLGRGVRDVAPMELLFRPMYRYQWWQPPRGEAP